MSNPFLDAAIEYARRGWCVVPLRPKDKRPIFTAWQLVAERHGTSEEHVRRWWGAQPDANVGILTGRASGLIVLDVDPRNGGDDYLLDSGVRTWGKSCAVVKTGSGGMHFYFRHPGGRPIASRTGKHGIARGVELKADGGQQVVAPPSIHPNGTPYTWSIAP